MLQYVISRLIFQYSLSDYTVTPGIPDSNQAGKAALEFGIVKSKIIPKT